MLGSVCRRAAEFNVYRNCSTVFYVPSLAFVSARFFAALRMTPSVTDRTSFTIHPLPFLVVPHYVIGISMKVNASDDSKWRKL